MKNLLPTIFILFLLIFSGTSGIFAQSAEQEAQAAIARKNFSQAREIYLKLAQENPENYAFINWIARLSAWLGDFQKSLQIYDQVLAKTPNNNEALLGKTYVLMWQKKYGKAKQLLALAEKNGSSDPAFLIAKINYFRYQNKLRQAREIIKIARESDTVNAEIAELEQIIEKTKLKTYQAGCEQNFEPFTATTTACFAALQIRRGADNLTVKAQSGKRFGKFYQEMSLNWQREINDKLTILANAALEPRNLNSDTDFGFNYKITRRLNTGANFRFWRLNGKTIRILSNNFSYSLNNKTEIESTLYQSSNKVLLLRLNRRINSRLALNFTYLKNFGSEKTEKFILSQNAYVISGKYQINRNMSLSGSYGLTQKGTAHLSRIYGFGFTFTK